MSRQRLQRKKRTQFEFKPRVIIIGDGDTEKDYFNRLKDLDYFKNVNIKFELGDESNFYTKLKEHLENKDNLFLVLDIDNVRDGGRFDKIERLISNSDYNIYYNNYSFETWLLNHKTAFASPIFMKDQYDTHFKKHFGIVSWSNNKNKNNRDKIMSQISELEVNNAVTNISNIISRLWYENPSSNIDKLIEKIKGIS